VFGAWRGIEKGELWTEGELGFWSFGAGFLKGFVVEFFSDYN
jgi:hypothetical protein